MQRLQAALEGSEPANLTALLAEMHAADLATLFADLDETAQQAIFDALDDEGAAELLDELAPEERAHALDLLSLERASDILEEMPSDEAADLLAELPTDEADALLERMGPDQADDVADLLRYPEDTAGGLMAKEFVRVTPEDTVDDVLSLLRTHHDDAEMIYYLYVLDDDERLLGIITLRRLIISDPAATLAEIMTREFESVPADMPQDEVAEVVRRHDLIAIPVLDPDGRMLGIITVDDIGDVVREEAAEELLEMSGSEEGDEFAHPWTDWRGWRSGLLALAGGVAASAMIGVFARKFVAWQEVATLLPLLLVLSMTAGSQAAIAMDRAYDNAVERHQTGRIFLRELLVGAIFAVLGGLLAGGLGYLVMRHHLVLAFGIAAATIIGLWAAVATGSLGALTVRRRGGWLGTTSLTVIIVLAFLISALLYLPFAYWTLRVSPHSPL